MFLVLWKANGCCIEVSAESHLAPHPLESVQTGYWSANTPLQRWCIYSAGHTKVSSPREARLWQQFDQKPLHHQN